MKLYLHIGIPKTGSTSIQHFLQKNTHPLSRQGVAIFPPVGSAMSPGTIAAAVGNPHVLSLYADAPHFPDTPPDPAHLAVELKKLLGGRPEKATVLSWEAIPYFFMEREDMSRLAEFLHSVFDEVEVVVYLRRQDAFHTSFYAQNLYNGRVFTDPDRPFSFEDVDQVFSMGIPGTLLYWFDYARLLDHWSEGFGKENITVRPFERGQLVDGDVVADFLSQLGCSKAGCDPVERTNQAIDYLQVEYLRHSLRHVPGFVNGRHNPAFHRLGHVLQEKLPRTTSIKNATAGARPFFERFANSNARIAREFLGRENGELFVDSPPEDNNMALPDFDVAKAIEITGDAWNAQWEDTQADNAKHKQDRANAEARAGLLQDCNKALYSMALSASGEQDAANVVLKSVPNIERRTDVQENLFQTFAIRDDEMLDFYSDFCPEILRIDQSVQAGFDSPSAVRLRDIPRPRRVLTFRCAPLFVCNDLFTTLFDVWPDVPVDVVFNGSPTALEPYPFASRLQIDGPRLTKRAMFARFDPEQLRHRYDLVIVPINGALEGYGEFLGVAKEIESSSCLMFNSWNSMVPAAEKVFESVEI